MNTQKIALFGFLLAFSTTGAMQNRSKIDYAKLYNETRKNQSIQKIAHQKQNKRLDTEISYKKLLKLYSSITLPFKTDDEIKNDILNWHKESLTAREGILRHYFEKEQKMFALLLNISTYNQKEIDDLINFYQWKNENKKRDTSTISIFCEKNVPKKLQETILNQKENTYFDVDISYTNKPTVSNIDNSFDGFFPRGEINLNSRENPEKLVIYYLHELSHVNNIDIFLFNISNIKPGLKNKFAASIISKFIELRSDLELALNETFISQAKKTWKPTLKEIITLTLIASFIPLGLSLPVNKYTPYIKKCISALSIIPMLMLLKKSLFGTHPLGLTRYYSLAIAEKYLNIEKKIKENSKSFADLD